MKVQKSKKSKITIVGCGYVGMSLGVLFSQDNEVTMLDIDQSRVDIVNNGHSTVKDQDIEEFLNKKSLFLSATTDESIAYKNKDFIVIATPTDYNPRTNYFDTSSVDKVVEDVIKLNSKSLIVIKSTIPVGHTDFLKRKFNTERIVFSPEFLREGQALKDNLYPSRVIIGGKCELSKKFAYLLEKAAKKTSIKTMFISSVEAEAVKLFSNTYLAMRVAFFNELDSYAMSYGISSKNIINGVCLDNRIGDGYNNPSFGYGGYCLPKDTKQLLANYENVPQDLIKAIVSSNSTRKDFIANQILKQNPSVVGIYRLVMKEGSDNFRSSSILGVMRRLQENNIKTIIYEPHLTDKTFLESLVIQDLNEFKKLSDIIITNRLVSSLEDVKKKCFTRDIFGIN